VCLTHQYAAVLLNPTLKLVVCYIVQLRIVPILDGQGILYSFETTPEVKVGIAFGSGSQSVPQTELPVLSTWLVCLLSIFVQYCLCELNRQGCGSPSLKFKWTLEMVVNRKTYL
jgi:hypothetical protein